MDIELAQALAENELLKSLLYCTKRSCNNCGKVTCENFQRQRIDCCGKWVSYKDYITELEQQIEKMKCPQNCRYGSISVWCDNSISIDCEKEKFLHEENWCDFCKNCKKWEIKEND